MSVMAPTEHQVACQSDRVGKRFSRARAAVSRIAVRQEARVAGAMSNAQRETAP